MQQPAYDLSQLRDIHLPEDIGLFPLAPGWWILLIGIPLLIIAAIALRKAYLRKTAEKRAALALLKEHYETFCSEGNAMVFLSQCNEILKRYCATRHPDIVSTSGEKWTTFLNSTTETPLFNKELISALSEGLYRNECKFSPEQLYSAAGQWLKKNTGRKHNA